MNKLVDPRFLAPHQRTEKVDSVYEMTLTKEWKQQAKFKKKYETKVNDPYHIRKELMKRME